MVVAESDWWVDCVDFDRVVEVQKCFDWLIGDEEERLLVVELYVEVFERSTKFRRFASRVLLERRCAAEPGRFSDSGTERGGSDDSGVLSSTYRNLGENDMIWG